MTTLHETTATEYATLSELTDARCELLLSEHRWGRIAAGLDGWPTILPVNYRFDNGSIVIRTGPGAKLADAPMTAVCFEIDDADPEGAWGWSVLVQGPAFDITDALDHTSEHLRSLRLKTWAPGRKDHWIRIAAARITGRSFGDVPGWG